MKVHSIDRRARGAVLIHVIPDDADEAAALDALMRETNTNGHEAGLLANAVAMWAWSAWVRAHPVPKGGVR